MDEPSRGLRPRIARIWRGRNTAARADEYARYLHEHGIRPLGEKALGVQMLREDRASGSAFVPISYGETMEAVSRLTGDAPTRIHHLDRDAEFLTELPHAVQILRHAASSADLGRDKAASPGIRSAPCRWAVGLALHHEAGRMPLRSACVAKG